MGAIGMLSGFCGTLMTPMAANFNIVPAALLELPDRNGVIKAQLPTALAAAGRQHAADGSAGVPLLTGQNPNYPDNMDYGREQTAVDFRRKWADSSIAPATNP